MIKFEQVKNRQSQNITQLIEEIKNFSTQILKPNAEILSGLLSGSIARGDYWPGKYGGAVDLTIFVENFSDFNAEEALGEDREEHIPGHFIKHDKQYYQIKIYDQKYFETFQMNNEAEKYAFFESIILFDKTSKLEQTKKALSK